MPACASRNARTGTLPLVWASEEPEATLGAYVQTYLKEDIQAEALVRNLPGFARFLPIAGLFHGQVLNVAGVARDAGVSRTTVDGFVEILEDTLIATRLPAFEARLRVRERRHPKLYFFDPGVARALCRRRGAVVGAERGALFEGFVYGMLRAIQSYDDVFDAVAYWSPAEARDTEVDFVISRGAERIAIEAKAGRAVHERDFRGLRAIADLPGLSRRVMVYGGDAVLRTQDGIEVWPVTTLAEALRDGRL